MSEMEEKWVDDTENWKADVLRTLAGMMRIRLINIDGEAIWLGEPTVRVPSFSYPNAYAFSDWDGRDGSFRILKRVEEPVFKWKPKLGDKVRDGWFGSGFTVVGFNGNSSGQCRVLIFNPDFTGGHSGARYDCIKGGPVPGYPKSHCLVSPSTLTPEHTK